jgi:hypothetical protein
MSRIMCVSSRKVKATRHSRRPAAPFGSGILRFVPMSRGFEPSADDRRAAAQMFADAGDPDYDTLAGEAAFLASLESLSPPPAGICRSCGEMAESLTYGYCDACNDAGTEATIKGANGRAGLDYRVH